LGGDFVFGLQKRKFAKRGSEMDWGQGKGKENERETKKKGNKSFGGDVFGVDKMGYRLGASRKKTPGKVIRRGGKKKDDRQRRKD